MLLPLRFEIYLICFGTASVIHAVQTILVARMINHAPPDGRADVIDGVMIGIATFLWQFGNFLSTLALSLGVSDTSLAFQFSDFVRDGSLVCFPLVFSYMCLHLPPHIHRTFRNFGGGLRYVLWPWTVFAVAVQAAAHSGFRLPFQLALLVILITLHIMLLFFVIFTITLGGYGKKVPPIPSLVKARRAGLIAGLLATGAFVPMLGGYWNIPIPFFSYIELASMMTTVPFVIAVAYRLYQFPFMDAFIREVISGGILLVSFLVTISVSRHVAWIAACAMVAAYCKSPLTRWVERTFIGYAEPVEEQEERIGTAIRALASLDEFRARVSEILAGELEAEWVEISAIPREDSVHRFEIMGSGLWLTIGLRVGGRQYMSRQLRIARTAALQLSAHHHQLSQHAMRELTARAQMRALQAQINPHFLFNTLNVLANLIHSNPVKAERVTEELADVFRYALESTRAEWVTLDEELHFIESYLEIEKARFDERLAYSFQVDASMRTLKIPPMILQPLVENAIKHGIGPKIEGGAVTIAAGLDSNRIVITVQDTGVGPTAVSRHRGAGIGLTNIRERLQHVYGEAGALRLEELHPFGTRAIVTLPQLAGVRS